MRGSKNLSEPSCRLGFANDGHSFPRLKKKFYVYFVPGAIFQSIVVGGGYATGREIVEYFTRLGWSEGLLAIASAFLVFALVLSLTFEIGRIFKAYDYRSFFRVLIGKYWFVYELVAMVMLLLTFAVLIAAATTVLAQRFDLSSWIAVILIFGSIAILEFYGRDLVTRVLTLWSVVLYAVFIVFVYQVFNAIPDDHNFRVVGEQTDSVWWLSGFKYALYNMMVIPIILFVSLRFENRQQAVGAGVIAALVAVAPAALLHLAFCASGTDVVNADVPVYAIMNAYTMPALSVAFAIMLVGTLIETGAGLIQGINERLDNQCIETGHAPLSKLGHTGVALAFLGIALCVSSFGMIGLIAKGYGAMAWAFFMIYFLPLLSVGVSKLHRSR